MKGRETWYLLVSTIVGKHRGLIGLNGKGGLIKTKSFLEQSKESHLLPKISRNHFCQHWIFKVLLDPLCALLTGSNPLSIYIEVHPCPSKEGLADNSSSMSANVTRCGLEICLPGHSECSWVQQSAHSTREAAPKALHERWACPGFCPGGLLFVTEKTPEEIITVWCDHAPLYLVTNQICTSVPNFPTKN